MSSKQHFKAKSVAIMNAIRPDAVLCGVLLGEGKQGNTIRKPFIVP